MCWRGCPESLLSISDIATYLRSTLFWLLLVLQSVGERCDPIMSIDLQFDERPCKIIAKTAYLKQKGVGVRDLNSSRSGVAQ